MMMLTPSHPTYARTHARTHAPRRCSRRLICALSTTYLGPTGQGVQAPKIQEAWMSNVIPIVQHEPAFVELAAWGCVASQKQNFPLTVV